ncbi:hypothetical protein Bca101_068038 [Brassica carinata]
MSSGLTVRPLDDRRLACLGRPLNDRRVARLGRPLDDREWFDAWTTRRSSSGWLGPTTRRSSSGFDSSTTHRTSSGSKVLRVDLRAQIKFEANPRHPLAPSIFIAEQPVIRRKTTRDVADPKRRSFQFDVQEICDNFDKGMMKALKDVNQIHKKSTIRCSPVAESSLFITEKSKGKSETHVEEFKKISDSLPTFDEYEEEMIESLMICEKNCDLPSLEPEFILDNEQTIVELTVLQPEHSSSLVLYPQVFEEEPLHQGPRLDSRVPLDEELGPIFDEEEEPGPVFDEEATSITYIALESHLCFDPGTSPAPLSPYLQKHCENSDLFNSLPDMFVKISSHDVTCFGLSKMK